MSPRFERAIDALEAGLRRSSALRIWLRSRRWCGETVGMRSELVIRDRAVLAESPAEALVLFLLLAREPAATSLLNIPLSIAASRRGADAFELVVDSGSFSVTEAETRDAYARLLVDGFRRNPKIRTRAGDLLLFRGESLGAFRSLGPPAGGDTSNVLAPITTSQGEVLFKSYKILDPQNREPSILERLRRRRFPHVPRFLGEVALGRGEGRLVLGAAMERLDAEDLFRWLTAGLAAELQPALTRESGFETESLEMIRRLAEATAALHEALADRGPSSFRIETFTADDAGRVYRAAMANLTDSLRLLAAHRRSAGPVPADIGSARSDLLDRRSAIEETLALLDLGVGTAKSVTHGDLHLAQVLRARQDGTLAFIDFEGEPDRPAARRSEKVPPLRDVATMNRSFSYVRHTVWREVAGRMSTEESTGHGPDLLERLRTWQANAVDAFSSTYLERTSLYPEMDADAAGRIVRGWMMEKALYELRYELKHRPQNFAIPLEGVLSLAAHDA